MTNQEAIDIIKTAIDQVEWDYPMDYAAAFDLAVKALEKQEVIAVPVDKLCELCEEIDARVPCVLCDKIMPEWCKQNNNLPLTLDEEFKCPTWKQLLTKWMQGLDAADVRQ